ncbi:fatty acid desaturase [Nocardioides sp. Bht2]|uniref:fatty acid desaturase n=1 Tax=Nocardioides sp. Bht2 TaxID=3392297 RepID=UPI0039B615AA
MTRSTIPESTGTAASPQPVRGLPDPGESVPALAWPTVLLWVGTLALFAVEMGGLLVWDWSRWATVPMGAAVTFLMFSVVHEATHHAVSTSTRTNDLFGYLSVPFVVPWATFGLVKYIHIEHHRNTNEPKAIDPDMWCDEGPAWQLPLRWATIDLWYIVFYLRKLSERPKREVVLTFTVFTVAVSALAGLVIGGYGEFVLWGVLVPQRFGILILGWWFDYLPHHGLTVTQREDKYRATRVRVGGEKVLTPLFVYQNYHLVHHLHPSVPFYRYVRAWRRNEQAYLDRNAAISTWFGRSLTASEYRTWRRITDELGDVEGAGAASRPRFHPLRVAAITPVTDESVALTFEVPEDLAFHYRYLQGQHLTLRAVIDGVDERRSYSLVTPVSAGELTVAVKRVEGGTFSNYVNDVLAVGEILDVMTPAGQFHTRLDPEQARHHVGVAAGSGITPLLSTLTTTLETEPESRFTLIYGNRTRLSTMFAAELDELQNAYGDRLFVHHVLSREPVAALSDRAGRIDTELVRELVGDLSAGDQWYLCGPEQMVTDLRTTLSGVVGASSQVLSEVFHHQEVAGAEVTELVSQVSVVLDGEETRFELNSTGETVLDAALQAGVAAPYSCAGGACGTCRARVLLGSAVMDQDHVLTEEDLEQGYVLTCQAHPTSAELRVDYDA